MSIHTCSLPEVIGLWHVVGVALIYIFKNKGAAHRE